MSIHPTLLDANVHTSSMFCQLCASRVQPHQCCFTCELHSSGKCGCRSLMPRGLVTNTKPVQLLPVLTKPGVTSFTVKDTIDVLHALKDTKDGRNTVRSFSSGALSFAPWTKKDALSAGKVGGLLLNNCWQFPTLYERNVSKYVDERNRLYAGKY